MVTLYRSRRFLALLAIALTWVVLAAGPVFAAKNRQIAYLKWTAPFWQIWVTSESGADDRQITQSDGDKLRISWFPDGKRLLFNKAEGQVYSVDLATGVEALVPIEVEGMTDAQLSPDGAWIAFSFATVNVVDNNDIWRVRSDGSDLQRLVAMNGLQHYPTWGSDSRTVVFLSGEGGNHHDIYRFDPDTRESEQLTRDGLYNFDPDVARDGRIAFSSNRNGDYDIWIRDDAGAKARPLAPAPGLDSQPSWSPDGKWLVFSSVRGGTTSLWKIRSNGKKLMRLTSSSDRCKGAEWAP